MTDEVTEQRSWNIVLFTSSSTWTSLMDNETVIVKSTIVVRESTFNEPRSFPSLGTF